MVIEKDDVVLEYQIMANSNPHETGIGKVKIDSNTFFKKIEESLIGLSVKESCDVKLKEEFGNYDNNLVFKFTTTL